MKKRKAKIKAHHLIILLIPIIAAVSYLVWKSSESKASTVPGPTHQAALNYTALGDSLTEGETPNSGFVPLFGSYVEQDIRTDVNITNHGHYGMASIQLLNNIQSDQSYRTAISNANLITIEIGLNDFGIARGWYLSGVCGGSDGLDCFRTIADAFGPRLNQIISEVRTLNNHAAIRIMDIYYMRVNLDKEAGNFNKFYPFLDQMNEALYSVSEQNNVPVARVHEVFNGPNGDEDGYENGYFINSTDGHPNQTGINIIAQKFRDSGYIELDQDNDGVAEPTENCPGVPNSDQANYNSEPFDLGPIVVYDDGSNPIADNLGNACDPDMDHDYLTNDLEAQNNTNPLNPDTDNDGNLDGAEVTCQTDPASSSSMTNSIVVRNLTNDPDNDGLNTACENAFGTNPNIMDSDSDGITDRVEVMFTGTNGTALDSDNDGCRDDVEMADVNGDRKVNSIDNGQVAQKFGATLKSSNYLRSFDMNGDGKISSPDLSFISQRASQVCPTQPANPT